MSDLAAVRIHSKTISIFSSRPIISRNRWTDGAWSSVLMSARRSRNVSSRRPMASPSGRTAEYCAGGPWRALHDAELDELSEAVLDVQAHAPERGHQRLDFERLAGPRAQESQQARAQGRLDEGTESCLDVARRIGPRT